MKIQQIKKSVKARWYAFKIFFKSILLPKQNNLFKSTDKLRSDLTDKDTIIVLCSGPSAKKLTPKTNDFYIVTNDSYRLVKDYSFLYYVNDGYFFRRFLANAPLCKKHIKTLFFYRKEDKLHHKGFGYFLSKLKLIKGSSFLVANFKTDINSANKNYNEFIKSLNTYEIPIKIQNSGIFMLLFGFYLAQKYNKKLYIYGLDLGVGGKVHFEKGGYVGKSITSDRVKINTQKQLEIIYKVLGDKVVNHSNFNPN